PAGRLVLAWRQSPRRGSRSAGGLSDVGLHLIAAGPRRCGLARACLAGRGPLRGGVVAAPTTVRPGWYGSAHAWSGVVAVVHYRHYGAGFQARGSDPERTLARRTLLEPLCGTAAAAQPCIGAGRSHRAGSADACRTLHGREGGAAGV